ncbi:MAG: PIG-L deacetylase family protein [Victivallaceae bacterium]
MSKTLIIVAHDDDEALMAGGYIAKFARYRDIAVLSSVRCTEEQANGAAENSKLYSFTHESLNLTQWNVRLHDLARMYSEAIAKHTPDILITHPPFDTHQEHKLVHDAVEIATRAVDMRGVGNCHYVPTIMFGYGTGSFENADSFAKPDCFVWLDDDHLQIKLDMLRRYGKEMKGVRSEEGAVVDAKFWGKLVNYRYAEAFLIKRFSL